MYRIRFNKFIPGIIWFIFVMILMCLPGEDIPTVDWLHINYFDKWVHVCFFGLMVFLFCWPFYKSDFSRIQRKYYFIKIALAASVWGLTIEFIQRYFIPGRSFDLLDWAADSLGAVISFFICLYFFISRQQTYVKQEKN